MREMTFDVPGISCEHCINAITGATKALGVNDVKVDLISRKVFVSYDPTKMDDEDIKDAIEDEGYEVKGETLGNTLPIRTSTKTLNLIQQ